MGTQRYSPQFKQTVVEELLAGAKRPDTAAAERGVERGHQQDGQDGDGGGGQDRRVGARRRPAHGGEPDSKKGRAAGAVSLGVKHALIAELSTMVPVRHLCAILGVSRSWYYAAQAERAAERDVALRAAIEEIVLEVPGCGYRRVTKALQRAGWTVNHKRVLRIMRDEALLCPLQRRWMPTTDSRHGSMTYPNLLLETKVTHLNQVWVADITYIRLLRGFAYLAALLDAFSRKVVGWALSRWIATALTLQALDHARAMRPVEPGLIHHSDRGVPYASSAYVERLQEHGIQISMAARGHPYENAQAESFFKTLKSEEVYLKEYRDIREAQQHLDRFIEDVYNTKRLYSALGYRPPADFELLPCRQPCELALVRSMGCSPTSMGRTTW